MYRRAVFHVCGSAPMAMPAPMAPVIGMAPAIATPAMAINRPMVAIKTTVPMSGGCPPAPPEAIAYAHGVRLFGHGRRVDSRPCERHRLRRIGNEGGKAAGEGRSQNKSARCVHVDRPPASATRSFSAWRHAFKYDQRDLSLSACLSSPHERLRYFLTRPSVFSSSTMCVVVRRTVSGLRLIESMPRRTRNSAISG